MELTQFRPDILLYMGVTCKGLSPNAATETEAKVVGHTDTVWAGYSNQQLKGKVIVVSNASRLPKQVSKILHFFTLRRVYKSFVNISSDMTEVLTHFCLTHGKSQYWIGTGVPLCRQKAASG